VIFGREIIMKRDAFYICVSTSKQDTENQRRELEAVADRSGWKIVKVYEDAGTWSRHGQWIAAMVFRFHLSALGCRD
jgi:hypothetical protein